MRIVLVEDDALISELIAELLAFMGHDVCGTAATELEAVDAATLHAPDFMIVDVNLQHGTGMAAMDIIHRRLPMPHIFMTGGLRRMLPKEAVVLFKPFGTADLTAALEQVAWQILPGAEVVQPADDVKNPP